MRAGSASFQQAVLSFCFVLFVWMFLGWRSHYMSNFFIGAHTKHHFSKDQLAIYCGINRCSYNAIKIFCKQVRIFFLFAFRSFVFKSISGGMLHTFQEHSSAKLLHHSPLATVQTTQAHRVFHS